MKTKWTIQPPALAGWYWWRQHKKDMPRMVYVTDHLLVCDLVYYRTQRVKELEGYWYGPNPVPEE